MHKFLLVLGALLISCSTTLAAKLPDDVQNYINNSIPGTDIRFDGVVILPDNTVYLPLFPSLFSDVTKLKVKESYPKDMDFKQKPDIIIFNNDFVLMKVISDGNGKKTVRHIANPPLQVRTGLLPQDMLVPSGLILPENIKGIIGNLKIDTKSEDIIKQTTKETYEEFISETEPVVNQTVIPQLKNKTLFVTTNYSKNILVLEPGQNSPKYSLAQKSIPVDVKAINKGKFLLVTSYERPFLDIISVADSRFIKQINLGTFPEEIIIDENSQKAYVTAPTSSIIFVIDLKTMSLIQKIRVNGYCEKLILTQDKIFYVDKMKNDIWAIETKNNYELKNIGKFPNVAAMAFANNQLYIASRTKSRIAIIDYSTLGLIAEFTTVNKPIAMELQDKYLYVLGSQNNRIQKINIDNGKVIDTFDLNTEGFSTGLNRLSGTDLVVVNDIKKNVYSIVDLTKGKVIKTYALNIPINNVIITDKVKLFN